ncbi:cytosolic carboxypeptidase 3-like isoform X2 [Oratosquilla oratoria]|uniref:cytosolic carboxypeptidase 3-like isoform X2 n=1 Tax=Oratosquilla oratoria TaxID=337810 RepID=UPI003F768756
MQFHSIYTGFGCSASGMASSDVEGAASRVQRLQHAFFPSRGVVNMGTLSEPREDDAVNTNRPSPHDGYICHRICSTPSSCSTEVTPGHTTTSGNTNTTTSNSACPCPGQAAGSLNDLYGVVREACAQQNVKWPVECQVLPDYVQHLEDWPLYPEPFYEPTGTELRPQPVGDESGRIVYEYLPASTVNYFTRSCVGGNKYVSDDVRPALVDETDATLQFESRFECGNLAKAVQVSECYYELHLRADLYTSRHTQWFYFAVSNTRKDITYRLSIVNLSKGDSLYNHGLRPLLYSCRDAREHAAGWRRCASNIVYYRNQDSEAGCYDSDDETEEDSPTYTLTFNITFPHDHDTVYVAHCYPYSYSDHQQHLLSIQKDPFKSTICRQRILCRSIAGNPVYLLTVTSTDQEEDGRKKRAIVLSARVHPGETPSSWIMKGALDFLTSQHPKAVELRNQFIFKIIPMINPDGVIVGNHRCSLVGRDLNRQYKMVVKEMFPPIWHIKAMVRRLMDEHGVVMFCDIHAHSRKHNMFLYGCENRRSQDNRLREQLFPLLLHYNSGDKLSFRSCKFKVQRCKEGTARVVVWMMGVLHSYTLEASFGGATEGPRAGTHFNILDFLTMGRQFCETLLEYFDPEPGKEKLRNKLLSRLIKKGSSADEPAAVDMSETNSSSGESERQASILRLRKKKNLKTQRKRTARTTVASVVERVTSQMRMAEPLDATEAAARTDTVQETSQDEAGRQESFTESYMERMQEMLASRLALSDNEVEGSSSRSFWDCGDSSSHWDSSRNAPSRHHPFVRSEFGCRSSLGNLGPVVARTLLYTPVRSPRTPKPSPHYTLRASRVASGGLYPSSRRATTGRHKEVSLRKSVILRETRRDESRREKETVKTESSPERNEGRGRGPGVVQQHRFHSQPVLVETSLQNNLTVTGEEMLVKDFSPLRGGSTSGNLHNSTSSYSSSNKMSTTHTSSPLPPPPPPPAVTPEPRTGTVKANVPRIHSSYDNDQLCADIASCDTLFLDIGARETPELIAARNLKGKVKKKKAPQTSATSSGSKSHVGDNGNYTKSKKSTSDALGDLNNDCEKDTQECAEDSQECTAETKTKKKIKIVIGAKKPKPKLSKKKTKMEKESV